MRFTIRDVLWLTVVMALGITLVIQHQRASAARKRIAAALNRDLVETIDFVEMPLSEAALYVSVKEGVPIFISDEIDGLKPVTGKFTRVPLQDALDAMLPPELEYEVENGWILIKPRRR
jgi:hypothetical protein